MSHFISTLNSNSILYRWETFKTEKNLGILQNTSTYKVNELSHTPYLSNESSCPTRFSKILGTRYIILINSKISSESYENKHAHSQHLTRTELVPGKTARDQNVYYTRDRHQHKRYIYIYI